MILQTGFRTDIPAFLQRVVCEPPAGRVLCWCATPYDPQSVTRYAINPDVVDLIGFCTKKSCPDASPHGLLRPYGQYWFVTITPTGRR